MNCNFDKIVSRLLLTGSILTLSLGIEGIHGMDSSKVDIRGIKFNADEDSMEYYKREADKGDLSHLVNLATIYYQGKDLDRDLDAAEKYFEKAAQLGHVPSKIFLQAIRDEKKSSTVLPLNDDAFNAIIYALEGNSIAQYDLGYHYYNGKGVPRNYEIAAKWFSHVASQKPDSHSIDAKDAVNKAHLLLAKMYHQGMGVVADSKKAGQHLEIPALDLYYISQNNDFYISFLEHGSRDENLMLYANYIAVFLGVKKIFKMNEKGDPNIIQESVAVEFSAFINNFPLSNFNKSFKIICTNQNKNGIGFYFYGVYKTSIEGTLKTQFNCECCLISLLIGKSFGNRKARDILDKIRNNKIYPGCKPENFSKLNEMLAVAEGRAPKSASKPNSEKTQKSPIKTNNDNEIRKVPLSVDKRVSQLVSTPNISNSNSIRQDKVKEALDRAKVEQAQTLFLKALGYFEGEGVNKDLPRALALFKSSADLGNIASQRSVGAYYMTGGCGAPIDYNLALKYLRLAADAGDAASQKNLGLMYLNGFGVEQDSIQAFALFTLAANGGNKSAAQCLAHMKQDGFTVKIERDNVEKNSENKVSNDISTKSQKKNVNNTNQSSKLISQEEKAEPVLQSSKKNVSQKDVIVTSTRKKGPTSPSQSSTTSTTSITLTNVRNITVREEKAATSTNVSNIPVREEKAKELKFSQKRNVEEKKSDVDDNFQNTIFINSDPVDSDKKEKKKLKLKIPKGPKWSDHRAETKEKKEKKTKKSDVVGSKKATTEESSCVSTSCADSDDKSHWSVSMSESEMSESFHESENKSLTLNQQSQYDSMKAIYPKLYSFINNSGVKNISQLFFKNSNLIKRTLSLMAESKIIEIPEFKNTKKGAKINANMLGNGAVKFTVHATHGSGAYGKWYYNPDVVVSFFEFIAKCDPIIADFLKIHFGEYCFSRDLTTSGNTNNNSPSKNDSQANESKPD